MGDGHAVGHNRRCSALRDKSLRSPARSSVDVPRRGGLPGIVGPRHGTVALPVSVVNICVR